MLALDHLVVAARSLDEGEAWCRRTLGVAPAPGGRHPMMGTHNRLLAIGSPRFPRSYLEIIAIDPEASAPSHRRWFDLDEAGLQAQLASGPRLVHWVVRCDDIDALAATWRAAGQDPGDVREAERHAADGRLLRWRICVRDDGVRLAGGAWPGLIEWKEAHPCDRLPQAGVSLQALDTPAAVEMAPAGLALGHSTRLQARLSSPRGPVDLSA